MEPTFRPACWWPCWYPTRLFGGKTRRNFNTLGCNYVLGLLLKYCSHIMDESGYATALIHCVGESNWIVASLIGMRVVHPRFRFWFEVSFCSDTEKLAIGFQSLLDYEWIDFGVFCWHMLRSLSSCLEGLKSAGIVEEWLFFDDIRTSIFTLGGLLVCSSNVPVKVSKMIYFFQLMSLINAMNFHSHCFYLFYHLLLASSDETK